MEETFMDFIDQIPSDIRNKTKIHSDANIIVFRPTAFVIGVETYLEDFHFVLPTSDPPPLKLEQQVYHFTKGKLISLVPETKMCCTVQAPTLEYIAINIRKHFFQDIAKEAVGKSELFFTRTNHPYSANLVSLICSFEEEIRNYQLSSPLMLQSISTQIVIQLLRESGISCISKKKPVVERNYINLAKEYMTVFYNANIKIEDICKEIHLSPYYFIRMFKEQTGQTPHEFLLSVRVNRAEEMLKMGIYTIEEVARLCGFVNSSHFSTHFKRIKGIPPSVYKKKYYLL